jgi:CHAT domain-containing protein
MSIHRLLLFLLLFRLPALWAQAPCAHPDTALAQGYMQKGMGFSQQQKMDSALTNLLKAQALYSDMRCWEQFSRSTYNLSIAYANLNPKRAAEEEQNIRQGLAALERLADTSPWRGKIHYAAGQYFFQQNRIDSARYHFQVAKDRFALRKQWADYIQVCRSQARLAHHQQNFVEMERFIDEAFLKNKMELNNDKNQMRAILQLYGVLYYRTGDYQRALQKTLEGLEVALASMQNREDTLQVVSYYNNIGLFYIEIGDIYKAEDYCNSALSLSLQLQDYYKASVIYQNLAESFQSKGQWTKALEYYQKALEMAQTIKPDQNKISQNQLDRLFINLRNGTAEAAIRAENPELVEANLQANLQLHKADSYKAEETYRIYGEWYLQQSNFEKADASLKRSLAENLKIYGPKHPLVAKVYVLLGDMEWKYGNSTQAMEWYLNAEQALKPRFDGDSSQQQSQQVSDKEIYLRVLEKKAQLLRSKPFTFLNAYQTAQQAVRLIDEIRNSYKSEGSKLFLQQRVIPIYEVAIQMALRLYRDTKNRQYLEEAFHLVEKSKSLLLLDALKTEEARAFGNVPDSLLTKERQLARDIAQTEKKLWEAKTPEANRSLREQLLNLKRQATKLQSQLEADYPKYYQLKYEEKTASLSQIQDFLTPQTLLIEFFVGGEQTYVFAISKDSVHHVQIPKTATLDMSITALRTVISTPRYLYKEKELVYKLFCQQSYFLYQHYLKDILEAFPNTKRLQLIPDGVFNYIPFEILLTEEISDWSKVDFRPLPYLLRRYIINYHYSATLMLFAASEQSQRHKSGILGFAPSYKIPSEVLSKEKDSHQRFIRSSVKELPGAQQELKNLQQLYQGDYFFGEQALESTFKAKAEGQAYSVIHLAMHGWVDPEQPPLSNLVFTYQTNSPEDNLLHAYELNLLALKADMVVLSACETGFGKYERGEGVVSLGRGFMYAGVPSLAMTLWPINDQATAYLMAAFYRELDKGLPRDEAMRNAKLEYLDIAGELTAHPFFWASFITLGENAPITIKHRWDWLNFGLIALFAFSIGGLLYLWWDNKRKIHT